MTSATETLTLTVAMGSYGHTNALKSGAIAPRGVTLQPIEVSPLVAAFRRMCRQLEFDVCEMALTTYLCAREHKLPFTALPVFLVRAFQHGAVQVNANAGISSPKDLEGKKVGVRAWTVTTGVWARHILSTDYGLDQSRVDWVVVDEEHVQQYQSPSNVTSRIGGDLAKMLADGDIAAALGIPKVDSPDVKPLFANADEMAAEAYKKTGVYPINHTLVVKDELLVAHPSLAKDLYDAYKSARDRYVAGLSASSDASDAAMKRNADVVGDPLPYGIEPNRRTLEEMIEAAAAQQILTASPKIEDIFVKGSAGW